MTQTASIRSKRLNELETADELLKKYDKILSGPVEEIEVRIADLTDASQAFKDIFYLCRSLLVLYKNKDKEIDDLKLHTHKTYSRIQEIFELLYQKGIVSKEENIQREKDLLSDWNSLLLDYPDGTYFAIPYKGDELIHAKTIGGLSKEMISRRISLDSVFIYQKRSKKENTND